MDEIFANTNLDAPLDPLKVDFVKGKNIYIPDNKRQQKLMKNNFDFLLALFKQRVKDDLGRFNRIDYYLTLNKMQMCLNKLAK